MPAPLRGACFGLALLFNASAAPTTSATAAIVWTVDLSGAGDFTTIQAALDSAAVSYGIRPDSILVAPGFYDEQVVYPGMSDSPPIVLRGAGGSAQTAIRKFCWIDCEPLDGEPQRALDWSPEGIQPSGLIVSGMTINDSLWIGGISRNPVFMDCSFLSHVRFSIFTTDRAIGCRFYAGATFERCYIAARDCRFIASRVHVEVGDYWTRFIGCSFEGPVDTAIVHRDGAHTDALRLDSCVFRNVGVAVASVRWQPSRGGVWAQSCRFEDIGSVAFTWDHDGEMFPNSPGSPLTIADSHFARCQRVVDWGGYYPAFIAMERDTLESCGPSSIRAAVYPGDDYTYPHYGDPTIRDLVALDQQGRLFDITLRSRLLESKWSDPPHTKLWLTGLRVQGGGDTLGVIRTTETESFAREVEITNSRFEGSTGQGLWISASSVVASGNTFAQIGGHALEVVARPDTTDVLLHNNTIVGSGGDGIRLPAAAEGHLFADIHHNLLVQNAGDGLHIGAPYVGSIASNDSWLNYGAAYFGGGSLDSNLTADPIFCDVAAGDLTVSTVSPCRPTGPHGQIGAHGEGCARLAGAGQLIESGRASVWPNPARGDVTFSLHGPAGRWRAEVFDVGGRRVWHSPRDAEGPIRWTGTADSGARVGAGLYWVRFSSPGQRDQTARLVWLQ